jgi:hypothetical protein
MQVGTDGRDTDPCGLEEFTRSRLAERSVVRDHVSAQCLGHQPALARGELSVRTSGMLTLHGRTSLEGSMSRLVVHIAGARPMFLAGTELPELARCLAAARPDSWPAPPLWDGEAGEPIGVVTSRRT